MANISSVWTPILVATIGAIASVSGSWLTAGKTAQSATDERLDEKHATIKEVQSQVQAADSQVKVAIERTDSVVRRADRLSGAVDQVTQKLQSLEVRLPTIQKLCSAFTQGKWRDSFIVPQNWSREQCRLFQMSVGAEIWQLGCVYPNDISLGADNGGVPPKNECDW